MRTFHVAALLMFSLVLAAACGESGDGSAETRSGQPDAVDDTGLRPPDGTARQDRVDWPDTPTDAAALPDLSDQLSGPDGEDGQSPADIPLQDLQDVSPQDLVTHDGYAPDLPDLYTPPDLTDATEEPPPDTLDDTSADLPPYDDAMTELIVPVDIAPDVPLEEQEFAVPGMSRWLVLPAKYEKPVQVTCTTRSGLGETIPNPGEYVVSFTAPDVQETPEGYLFPTPGTWQVTCTDAEHDLVGSAEFVVAHELTAPGLSALSGHLSEQGQRMQEALDAAQADDGAALTLALEAFHEARVQASTLPADLTLTPPGGWPDLAELQGKLDAAPDDGAYATAVAQVAAAAGALHTACDGLSNAPSPTALGAIAEATNALNDALAEARLLAPGALGIYQSMDSWEAAIAAVHGAQDAYGAALEEVFAHPELYGGEPCPNCFTLGELATSIAIQGILSTLPSYSGLLKDAGKAAASMAVMMMVADAIDAAMPAGPNAPEIQYIMPGYGNAVNDGAALSLLVSGFDPFPGNNVVLFIGPDIGDTVVNAVDLAMSTISALSSLDNWENVFELGGAIVDTYNALDGDLELMAEDIPGLLSTGVVPLQVLSVENFLGPDAGMWDQIVSLSPLPQVNNSWLPKVGILLPIVFSRGNGESWEIVIL